jgi:alpha-glucoside transport system permease protein
MSTEKLMRRLVRGPLHVTLLIIALIWMTPTVGTLISSFRSPQDVRATGWWSVLQQPLNFMQYTLENYRYIMTRGGLARSFLNSLIITVPSTLLPIFFASLAAYAFAWMRFPGRHGLFMLVIGLIVVPLQMTFIPLLRWIFEPLGLYGTFMGLWLAHTGYGLPFAIFLLRNFFGSLPKELLESAFIDGASWWTAFWRLVLPLSVPALASLAIFQFLWVWNDLLVALIYVGGKPDVAPITWQIANLVGSRGQDWHLLTAGAFISIALPLTVFLLLQRYFVRGILAGSVKG